MGKSEVKKWANQKGEGKLFSCTLVDSSGEIRMTAFKDACDKYYDLVENGHVYLVSNAVVKIAKRQFGSVKNDYEIHLEPNSLIQEADESVGDCTPMSHYEFVPIAKIGQLDKDSFVDVLAVATEASPVQSITAKTTQRQLVKRDVNLVDSSSTCIKLTVWGDQAEKFPEALPVLVAIKSAKISDFNGRSLSSVSTSILEFAPKNLPQAQQLWAWYSSQNSTSSLVSLSKSSALAPAGNLDRKMLESIKTEHMGMSNEKVPEFN